MKDTLEHLYGDFKCPFKKCSPALIRAKTPVFVSIILFKKKLWSGTFCTTLWFALCYILPKDKFKPLNLSICHLPNFYPLSSLLLSISVFLKTWLKVYPVLFFYFLTNTIVYSTSVKDLFLCEQLFIGLSNGINSFYIPPMKYFNVQDFKDMLRRVAVRSLGIYGIEIWSQCGYSDCITYEQTGFRCNAPCWYCNAFNELSTKAV